MENVLFSASIVLNLFQAALLITYFQHSVREDQEHSEEILDQEILETQQGELQILHPHI